MWSRATLTRNLALSQIFIHGGKPTDGYNPLAFNIYRAFHPSPRIRGTGITAPVSSCSQLAARLRAINSRTPPIRPIRRSGTTISQVGILLLITTVLALSSLSLTAATAPEANHHTHPASATRSESSSSMTAGDILPGRPGNLTPDQEESLRRLWSLVLRICQGSDEESTPPSPTVQAHASISQSQAEKPKKRGSLFSRRGNTAQKRETANPAIAEVTSLGDLDADDKYGQNKQFLETLARQSPESIRETIWSMVKHDNPDALLLRFLRARKWDVDKALIMLISTMNWRATEMHVDDDIMKHGEGAAAEAERGEDDSARTLGHDFLAQMRMGKSFLHGSDKVGRPICFVRVRLHRQGEHSEEALERNTVYVIETARMVLQPPIDTATIIFDMTGFSMANMDYTPVKFMIKCFEANYPESLGAVLVYKAPWVFQGIWKIIRGWLDPVVASKVHFLNNAKEMAEYIDLDRLPKEIDGKDDWEYRYVEPMDGENARMADTATRDRLLEARWRLVEQYEQSTLDWLRSASTEEAANHKTARAAMAEKLRESYWELDPYLRARSLYDRLGMIKAGGVVDFYPAGKDCGPGAVTLETSPNDVD